MHEPDENLDRLAHAVIGAAIAVHNELGAGLSEDMYEKALVIELNHRQLCVQRQVIFPVQYRGQPIGTTRIDLIVDGRLIVELKACETLAPIHRSQAITYLRVTGIKLALLINFNGAILKDGIKRIVLS